MTKVKIILLFTLIHSFTFSCCRKHYQELEFESLIPIVASILESEDSLFINEHTPQAKIIYPKSIRHEGQAEMSYAGKLGIEQIYFYSKKEIWFVVNRVQYNYKQSEILIGYCPGKDAKSLSKYRCIVKKDNNWYFAQNDIMMD